MKYLLTMLLSGTMTFSSYPVAVSATETTQPSGTDKTPEEIYEQEEVEESQIAELNALDEEGSLEGEAYAVLTEQEELIFFRSYDKNYPHNRIGTYTDIKGNSYKGTVYTKIETSIYSPYDENFESLWALNPIQSVKVAEGQTIRPISTSYWFYQCDSLTELQLDGLDTSRVTEMKNMFAFCQNLETLNLNNIDTGNVTNMEGMFLGCSNLKEVTFGEKFTKWLNNAYLPNGNWTNEELGKTFKAKELYRQYSQNGSEYAGTWLKSPDSSTDEESTAYAVFANHTTLVFFRSYYDYANGQEGKFEDINNNIYTGTVYTGIETDEYPTSASVPWRKIKSSMQHVRISEGQTIQPISTNFWFSGCNYLESIDLSGLDTSKVTGMKNMFSFYSELTSLDLSNLDTSNVVDMSGMFHSCRSMESLDLSSFETSNVKYMNNMFEDCRNLKNLDLRSFNTGNVIEMNLMFSDCKNLKSLDLTSFDTEKVVQMQYLFQNCDKLEEILLGEHFTQWNSKAPLPTGIWENQSIGKSLSASELLKQYPENAVTYKGLWVRNGIIREISIPESLTILVGETVSLNPTFLPSDSVYNYIGWDTSNHNIARVEGKGKLIGVKPGRATITAIPEGHFCQDTCDVMVQFHDVTDPEKSFYEPVYYAVASNVTTGTSTTHFSPSKPCTRAQFVTFLWRIWGKPNPTMTKSPFVDVQNKDLSYYKAVLWAYETGITTGTSANTFSPDKTCTRAQVATFLWRSAGKIEPSLKTNPFKDIEQGRSYTKAVLWAYARGITTGTSSTTFSPDNPCTRAQTVTFLWRMFREPE